MLLAAACGSVSSTSDDASGAAGAAAGGAGGELVAPGGAGGSSSGPGGSGGDNHGGRGGAGDDCLDTNASGFAWNTSCSDVTCRASCQLDGAHYVGCVKNSAIGTYCYESCAACPQR